MIEPIAQFEGRKKDHIEQALKPENEALGLSGFDRVQFQHEALPDLNFSDISIQTKVFGVELETPFLVSSMTAGHAASPDLNIRLAKACERRGWMMGVGSQRRELTDIEARLEWKTVRKAAPRVRLLGNIGLSQLIHLSTAKVQELVDSMQAWAMIVHLNPLQECLQPEGTPDFRGGLEAISRLAGELSVPVIVKETGCGISGKTAQVLKETKIKALDVSGFGGTHWGRIEGARATENSIHALSAETFKNWGIPTIDSLKQVLESKPTYEVWASGGVRTGLDAAKALALGATVAGFAKPILAAALKSEKSLDETMKLIEQELKTAMFCTNSKNISDLKNATLMWRE